MSDNQISILISALSLFISLMASSYFYTKSKTQSKFPILVSFCKSIPVNAYSNIRLTNKMWKNYTFIKNIWPQKNIGLIDKMADRDKMMFLNGLKKDTTFIVAGYNVVFIAAKKTIEIYRFEDIDEPNFD